MNLVFRSTSSFNIHFYINIIIHPITGDVMNIALSTWQYAAITKN